MAWDDDKGPGDGLPSSEWDAHVAHQKKNRPIVQASEPPVGDIGQVWVELVEVFAKDTTYVDISSLGNMRVTTDGKIVYTSGSQISLYDIDTDTVEWTNTASNVGIDAVDVNETGGAVATTGNDGDNTYITIVNLSDGSTLKSQSYSLNLTNPNSIALNDDGSSGYVGTTGSSGTGDTGRVYDLSGNYVINGDDGTLTMDGDIESIVTDSAGDYYIAGRGVDDGIAKFSGTTEQWSTSKGGIFGDNLFLNLGGRLFHTFDTTEELSTSTGTSQWTYLNTGVHLGFDNTNNNIYIADDSSYYVIDALDGSEISSNTMPTGVTADFIGWYSGDIPIGSQSDNTIGTYATLNQYREYYSDGSIWMKSNR